jgi:hypothetical protein
LGAAIHEPTGGVRYREVLADGVRGAQLQTACRAMVTEQLRDHGAPKTTLAVLHEIGTR